MMALLVPAFASAHEVYVLSPDAIAAAIADGSPSPLLAFLGNESRFFFWAFVCAVVFSTVLFASLFRAFETRTASLFSLLKRAAHPLVRITAGVCLIVYGATSRLYGPELPLEAVFAGAAPFIGWMLVALGACITVGLQTRLAATLALLVYAWGFVSFGPYLLTYTHHAGAYIFLIILGGGPLTLDHRFGLGWALRKRLERASSFAFPLLRVAFGASIVYAAVYAKYLHSNLALEVVTAFGLERYFPFDPLFVVLGAFIIELLAGLMLILGIEIRWTALFLVFWLTLGHLYFDEGWWVHLPLYGYGLALLAHGYDRFTVLGRMFKKRGAEPML